MTERDLQAENPNQQPVDGDPLAAPSLAEPGNAAARTSSGAAIIAAQDADAEGPQNRRARRAAAARARNVRGQEMAEAEAIGLDAQEILDEALTRNTATVTRWLRRNSSLLQGLLAAGLVAWAGWGVYSWRVEASRAKASDLIATAVRAARGEIGDPEKQGQPNEQGIIDPTPIFKDSSAREQAALTAFELAVKQRSGTVAAAYAELGLAATQLDAKKYDEALGHFEALNSSAAAKTDLELRGRALEGLAQAQEGKGDGPAARKTYTELSALDASSSGVGLYGQARLAYAAGDLPAAREAITQLNAKLAQKAQPEDPFGFSPGYLRQGAKLLSDVLGVVAPAPSLPAGGPKTISQEQLKRLQREVQEKINAGKSKAPSNGSPAGE